MQFLTLNNLPYLIEGIKWFVIFDKNISLHYNYQKNKNKTGDGMPCLKKKNFQLNKKNFQIWLCFAVYISH